MKILVSIDKSAGIFIFLSYKKKLHTQEGFYLQSVSRIERMKYVVSLVLEY